MAPTRAGSIPLPWSTPSTMRSRRPATPASSSRSWKGRRHGGRHRSSVASVATQMPLWGIPFAVKDNIDAAGLPTTAACPAFAYTPKVSATAVDRLLAAGAHPDRQDQPRPVRDRPGGRAHALSGAQECVRSRRSCRAGRARARRLPWRAGSCPSRSAPIRRGRAACPPVSTTSWASSPPSAPSPPAASSRPAARSTACRSLPARSMTRGPSTR